MSSDPASDREILSQIEDLFFEKLETPFDEGYNNFIETLSFSSAGLEEGDSAELIKSMD